MLADFTAAHDLTEKLRILANSEGGGAIADGLCEAADMIELMADRINHLTNIREGQSEMIAELRAGLAELKTMVAPNQ